MSSSAQETLESSALTSFSTGTQVFAGLDFCCYCQSNKMKMKWMTFFFYTGGPVSWNHFSLSNLVLQHKFVFVNIILLCFQATNSYQSIYPELQRVLPNDIFLQVISNTCKSLPVREVWPLKPRRKDGQSWVSRFAFSFTFRYWCWRRGFLIFCT